MYRPNPFSLFFFSFKIIIRRRRKKLITLKTKTGDRCGSADLVCLSPSSNRKQINSVEEEEEEEGGGEWRSKRNEAKRARCLCLFSLNPQLDLRAAAAAAQSPLVSTRVGTPTPRCATWLIVGVRLSSLLLQSPFHSSQLMQNRERERERLGLPLHIDYWDAENRGRAMNEKGGGGGGGRRSLVLLSFPSTIPLALRGSCRM